MARQLLNLNLAEYPELDSLVGGQDVRLSIVAKTLDKSEVSVTLRIESVHITSKQRMSTQEQLTRMMVDRMGKIANTTADTAHV